MIVALALSRDLFETQRILAIWLVARQRRSRRVDARPTREPQGLYFEQTTRVVTAGRDCTGAA